MWRIPFRDYPMAYNPEIHHRQSIRLQGYDYTRPGAYFVTLCTCSRECLFGDVIDENVSLNEFGHCVKFTWFNLPNHNINVTLDAFIVMPNHIHGIIVLNDDLIVVGAGIVGAGSEPAPTIKTEQRHKTKRHGLPEIVRQFKTFSARRINKIRRTPGTPVWQRNYYEHVIRNDNEMNHIREYIIHNSSKWETDRNNPENMK